MITKRMMKAVNGKRRVIDSNRSENGVPVGLADPSQISLILFLEEIKSNARLAIVIVTRNRQKSLIRTLYHLTSLEEKYPIVVVDNASEDNTVRIVRNHFPDVKLIALDNNYGAVARNFGVEIVDQPYIAFCDDDSWWALGSLSQAVEIFDNNPKLCLIMSNAMIEAEGRDNPFCQPMEESPLPNNLNLPGIPIPGSIACGAIVRRSAFRSASGFNHKFGIRSGEELLSVDKAKDAGNQE